MGDANSPQLSNRGAGFRKMGSSRVLCGFKLAVGSLRVQGYEKFHGTGGVQHHTSYRQSGDHNNFKGDNILSCVSVLQLLCALSHL